MASGTCAVDLLMRVRRQAQCRPHLCCECVTHTPASNLRRWGNDMAGQKEGNTHCPTAGEIPFYGIKRLVILSFFANVTLCHISEIKHCCQTQYLCNVQPS